MIVNGERALAYIAEEESMREFVWDLLSLEL